MKPRLATNSRQQRNMSRKSLLRWEQRRGAEWGLIGFDWWLHLLSCGFIYHFSSVSPYIHAALCHQAVWNLCRNEQQGVCWEVWCNNEGKRRGHPAVQKECSCPCKPFIVLMILQHHRYLSIIRRSISKLLQEVMQSTTHMISLRSGSKKRMPRGCHQRRNGN